MLVESKKQCIYFLKFKGFAKIYTREICQPSHSLKLTPAKLNFEGRPLRKFVPLKVCAREIMYLQSTMSFLLLYATSKILGYWYLVIMATKSTGIPFCLRGSAYRWRVSGDSVFNWQGWAPTKILMSRSFQTSLKLIVRIFFGEKVDTYVEGNRQYEDSFDTQWNVWNVWRHSLPRWLMKTS